MCTFCVALKPKFILLVADIAGIEPADISIFVAAVESLICIFLFPGSNIILLELSLNVPEDITQLPTCPDVAAKTPA